MTTNQDDLLADPIAMGNGSAAEPTGRYGRYVLPTGPGKAKEHTSPSTLGKSLEDGFGLGVWRGKRVAWAIATRPDLALKLASIPLADLDKSEDAKEVMRAAELVGATDEGSNLGTAIHNILQRVDQGEQRDAFHPYFLPIVDNYLAALADAKLTVIPELIERVVLCDRYGCAGKFDNIMAEADGTLVLVDKKSEDDPTDGPQSICTQLGMYANSDRMMNYATGQYEAMPVVRKDYAIVIHIDRETFEVKIHRFDIERGWASARLAWEKREWNKAKHLCHPYITNGQWVPQGPTGMAPQPDVSHYQQAATRAVQQVVAADAPGAPMPAPHETSEYALTEHIRAAGAPAATNGQQADAQAVANLANAVLDEAHKRVGSTEQHGTVVPQVQQPAPSSAGIEPATRVEEIMAVRHNDKPRLQTWAKTLGCTDLAHHRKWLAEWIVAATPGSGAVEPSEGGAAKPAGQNPQTMAQTGLPAAPAQPPGQPITLPDSRRMYAGEFGTSTMLQDISTATDPGRLAELKSGWLKAYGPESWVGSEFEAAANARLIALQPAPGQDFTPAAIVQEIVTAPDMDRIMSIWQRVVGALGQGGWSGEIKAAADARVAVLRAPVQPAGQGGLPY